MGGRRVLALEGGAIPHYPSNGNFEAACAHHRDERCTLTRAGNASSGSSPSRASAGRPLGLLAAWLAIGMLCEDKAAHKAPLNMKQLSGPEGFDSRKEDREALAASVDSAFFFEQERPPAAGQGSEPVVVA